MTDIIEILLLIIIVFLILPEHSGGGRKGTVWERTMKDLNMGETRLSPWQERPTTPIPTKAAPLRKDIKPNTPEPACPPPKRGAEIVNDRGPREEDKEA